MTLRMDARDKAFTGLGWPCVILLLLSELVVC